MQFEVLDFVDEQPVAYVAIKGTITEENARKINLIAAPDGVARISLDAWYDLPLSVREVFTIET
jgi:hypothetical protein